MIRKTRMQSGNVFFIVIVVVALFAALGLTFARGAKQGGGRMGARQADLAAVEILDEAAKLERTVNRLRAQGCSENQMNFTNIFETYANPDSPADLSCHIFAPGAGNLQTFKLRPDIQTPCCTGGVTASEYGTPRFSGAGLVQAGGTPIKADLSMLLGDLQKSVCIALNDRLGVDNPGGNPKNVAGTCYNTHHKFTGTFSGDNTTWCGVAGERAACVYDAYSDGHYYFYNILIER